MIIMYCNTPIQMNKIYSKNLYPMIMCKKKSNNLNKNPNNHFNNNNKV